MKGLVKRNGIYHYRIFAQGRGRVRSTGCTELRAATRAARELKAKWLRQAPLPKKEPETNVIRDELTPELGPPIMLVRQV
jgi:hypothetical protein